MSDGEKLVYVALLLLLVFAWACVLVRKSPLQVMTYLAVMVVDSIRLGRLILLRMIEK